MEGKSKYYYDYCRNKDCECEDDERIPAYYIGKNGMMARDVVYQFDLTFNVGTAVTYCLRSKNKHNDGGKEDLKKAIAHLTFELEQIEDN
tara:strand:+ start:293 stop:562 length:270 start_codon:yes stop_codon:yes gene_type:complete